MANPVLVEVLRGAAVESFHRGSVAVVDADGATVISLGDIERPVFPRSAVKAIQASNPDAVRPAEPKPDSKPAPAETAPTEYELARTRTALATAREAELRIAVKEGTYVLASAVANEVAGQMAQEIATIESQVLRAGARAIADENGLDFRAVHATLKATWRAYREKRRDAKSAEAEAAEMSDEEQERDV